MGTFESTSFIRSFIFTILIRRFKTGVVELGWSHDKDSKSVTYNASWVQTPLDCKKYESWWKFCIFDSSINKGLDSFLLQLYMHDARNFCRKLGPGPGEDKHSYEVFTFQVLLYLIREVLFGLHFWWSSIIICQL